MHALFRYLSPGHVPLKTRHGIAYADVPTGGAECTRVLEVERKEAEKKEKGVRAKT